MVYFLLRILWRAVQCLALNARPSVCVINKGKKHWAHRPLGKYTSTLTNLLCLILSNVSECHQFNVIKLIILLFLSECQEWPECDLRWRSKAVYRRWPRSLCGQLGASLHESWALVSFYLRPFGVLRLQLSIFLLSKSNPRGSVYSFRYRNEGRKVESVKLSTRAFHIGSNWHVGGWIFLQAGIIVPKLDGM